VSVASARPVPVQKKLPGARMAVSVSTGPAPPSSVGAVEA
jgi:hypothetical protein